MDGFVVPIKFTENKLIEYLKNQLLNKATLLIAAAIIGAIIKHFTPTEVDRVIDKVLLACGVPESALKTLDSLIPGDSDDDTHAH